MQLAIDNPSALDLNFRSNLFKMQTDQLSFERFEELFDKEEEEMEMPHEPLFDNEWKRCKNFFLHSEKPAVFVAVADIMQFMNQTTQTIKFLINYEIKSEAMTAKMSMNAGEVDIDYRMLCETNVKFEKAEIYKDLLAITSASDMVEMHVKLQKPPKLKLEDFLVKSMNFIQLKSAETEDLNIPNLNFSMAYFTERMETDCELLRQSDTIFLYSSDNYFKGMLIRLMKPTDEVNIKLKIYLRVNHQIVALAKAIYATYSERCTIKVNKKHETDHFLQSYHK